MKLKKFNSILEAVEDYGKAPPEKYIDYVPETDPIPDAVMPISFVGAVKDTEKQREKANKLIADRRKVAIDATESDYDDRFNHMTEKEKKFNNGEKVELDENLFQESNSVVLTEAIGDYTVEVDFDNYKPWSGAVPNYQEIVDAGKLDQLKDIVSELYPDNIDATTLNDLIWYEYDFLKEVLGMEQDVEEEE